MEQGIVCSNHPDKNAIRLCDSCDMPFCAECLRKNLLGFYYCQRCYPRLFENTAAPEYEIPCDEKILRRMLKKDEPEIKEDSTNYVLNTEFIKFIKPDFKKIILTLILLSPLLLSILGLISLNDRFMNLYILYLLPFAFTSCFFGGFDCLPGVVSAPFFVVIPVSLFVGILPWYLISCLIVHLWSKILRKRFL